MEHKFAFFSGNSHDYKAKLIDKTIGESRAYSPLVEMNVEEYFMIFGDGTNIRYYNKDIKLPNKYQMAIEFEDNSHLVLFNSDVWKNWVREKKESMIPFIIK